MKKQNLMNFRIFKNWKTRANAFWNLWVRTTKARLSSVSLNKFDNTMISSGQCHLESSEQPIILSLECLANWYTNACMAALPTLNKI